MILHLAKTASQASLDATTHKRGYVIIPGIFTVVASLPSLSLEEKVGK